MSKQKLKQTEEDLTNIKKTAKVLKREITAFKDKQLNDQRNEQLKMLEGVLILYEEKVTRNSSSCITDTFYSQTSQLLSCEIENKLFIFSTD